MNEESWLRHGICPELHDHEAVDAKKDSLALCLTVLNEGLGGTDTHRPLETRATPEARVLMSALLNTMQLWGQAAQLS